jgi:hypothetical protein
MRIHADPDPQHWFHGSGKYCNRYGTVYYKQLFHCRLHVDNFNRSKDINQSSLPTRSDATVRYYVRNIPREHRIVLRNSISGKMRKHNGSYHTYTMKIIISINLIEH